MQSTKESVCCQEIAKVSAVMEGARCITEHAGFSAVCLNVHVLRVAYLAFRQEHGPLTCSQNR